MLIASIGCAIPTNKIHNEEILDQVRCRNWRLGATTVQHCIDRLGTLFIQCGCDTRYWRLRDEKIIDLISCAVDQAVARANIGVSDIDVVVFSSVHRAFVEPASASVLCGKLGIRPRRAFDVVDACMGWATSLEILSWAFKKESAQIALIINPEFPLDEGGAIDPSCFDLSGPRDIEFKFPALTMGEAVSATIVVRGEEEKWIFERDEAPEHHDLCMVPLRNAEEYLSGYSPPPRSKLEQMSAYGSKMAIRGFRVGADPIRRLVERLGAPDVLVPHSISTILPKRVAALLGYEDRIASTFSLFGNLSTASLPVSLAHHWANKRIRQGQRVFGWVASAGLKYAAFNISLNADFNS